MEEAKRSGKKEEKEQRRKEREMQKGDTTRKMKK
jgi:hypothetical protein